MNYNPAPPIRWNRSIGWNLDRRFRRNMPITQKIHDGADCYPWTKTFVLWPRRSISNQLIWMTVAYKRRYWAVWGTGFHMEPVVEYATIFDILANQDQ